MGVVEEVRRLAPELTKLPPRFDSSYDAEADVLYVRFEDVEADDSDLTDDDLVLRYRDGRLIGITVLHASKREGLHLPA